MEVTMCYSKSSKILCNFSSIMTRNVPILNTFREAQNVKQSKLKEQKPSFDLVEWNKISFFKSDHKHYNYDGLFLLKMLENINLYQNFEQNILKMQKNSTAFPKKWDKSFPNCSTNMDSYCNSLFCSKCSKILN